MVDRSQLYAWGAAGMLHVLGAALFATHSFQADALALDEQTIELAIVLPAPVFEPEPQIAPEPKAVPKPAPIRQELPQRAIEPEPALPPETLSAPKASEAPVPSIERKITRRVVGRTAPTPPTATAPYRETPPGPVEQTLRAFQCARLSPSQRRLCPSTDEDDAFISVMVAEARSAKPIYDPVLNVYRTRTLLDRIGNGPPQAGAFSNVENASHLGSDSSADAATSGLTTRLNAKPEPVFDGGRYKNWDSDAGRPSGN